MDVGIGLPATIRGVERAQLLDWARRAEARGFSSLGTIDRIVYGNYEPLIALAAAAALLLAALGVHGVIAHSVAERRREFGIRIALGATRAGVVRMVLGQVVVVLCGGVALGLILAIVGGKTAASLLYGVQPHDAAVLAPAAALVALAGIAAGLLPAVRASRTAPAECLRE